MAKYQGPKDQAHDPDTFNPDTHNPDLVDEDTGEEKPEAGEVIQIPENLAQKYFSKSDIEAVKGFVSGVIGHAKFSDVTLKDMALMTDCSRGIKNSMLPKMEKLTIEEMKYHDMTPKGS